MVTAAGVPAEEALSDIGMNDRRAMIHLERDDEEEWIKSLEEIRITHSVDQWAECLTRPYQEYEVPNIDLLISVFPEKKG